MKCKVACLQLNTRDDITANEREIEAMVREAARNGAQLITLPENAFIMKDRDKPLPPKGRDIQSLELCCALARELGIWLLIGSLHVPAPNDPMRFNRSILIDAQGNTVAAYDKIHLFDATLANGESYRESEAMCPGAEAKLAQTPWGKLGMSVCYDLRFPHLFRALAKAGADFLSIPAAFVYTTGIAHWHVLLRARAIENGCYVIAPAQCGLHYGTRKSFGHSLIVGPWGEILAEASEDKTEIIYAEIDAGRSAQVRAQLPSLQHDRTFSVS